MSVIFHNWLLRRAFCQFSVSAIVSQQQLGNRLLVELLLVSRLHNIDVCRSASGFITHSLYPRVSSSPMGFTLISSAIARSRHRNSVREAHAIECAAFTLRVAQMETATLATSIAGEKKFQCSKVNRDRRVFVCFRNESIPVHLNLHS